MWNPPQDYTNRPVAILGGGVLGRRIGEHVASVYGRYPRADRVV